MCVATQRTVPEHNETVWYQITERLLAAVDERDWSGSRSGRYIAGNRAPVGWIPDLGCLPWRCVYKECRHQAPLHPCEIVVCSDDGSLSALHNYCDF